MPFDQFTMLQLAGDQLPGAGQEGIIATGFHRNTMINEEGGIDPLEFRFHSMTDRVATTGATWLGLTLGCAQCHTHKYDPLTHTEYFKLMAFLDNAEEYEAPIPTPAQLQLAKELCNYVEKRYQELQSLRFEKILKDYNDNLYKKNMQVKLKQDNVTFECIIDGVASNGDLMVTNGLQSTFTFGEVIWEIPKIK